jgi:ATP-dependent helicase/nuclease subunit B
MPIREPRVFNIPPGAPFLPTLARALIDGRLIPGFPGAGGPLALASATIYVPTQRSAAALAKALLEASGGRSVLLPRIAPLGAFEPDDTGAFYTPDGEEAPRPGPPPAIGELTRRHVLARLVRAWGKALRGAIRRVDADGRLVCDTDEPALVATTPAQAYALAGDLAALIDDMIIEGVDWRRIESLAPEAYDSYWRITLDFLKIAFAHWPQWLEERRLIDRAKRVSLLVHLEIGALEQERERRGPTIIAGSTGANRATAALIAAIARSPRGAVVLPGLDVNLDERAWGMIGAGDGAAQGLAGHPQALLHRLIRLIGIRREDVIALGAPVQPLATRAAFLSEALRPAEATDVWRERDRTLSAPALGAALSDVSIIVADTEAEEALALAIAMREVLETPGKTAALITPNPSIARRVAAELGRWDAEVEDSAGRTLGQTPVGALARLILVAGIEMTPLALTALLAHPALRLGRARGDLDRAARALELGVFRATPLASLGDLDQAFAAARAALESDHVHPAIRAISEAQRTEAEHLARDLVAALAPLRALRASPLLECLAAHDAALEAVLAAPGADPSEPHGLDALIELMDEWRDAAAGDFSCTLVEYTGLFDDALAGVRAPPTEGGHPRLKILGLLEARLLSFDRVLLAGLDEKVCPPAVETDAFLNRPMRAKLGLSAPERRIGQTALDFANALGAQEAILSRAKKRDGEPTVASRFLQRMGAAAGAEAIVAAERRGETYLRFARALDQPARASPIARPAPTPPVDMRPRSLSVTRVETLRRDPYAIYAERILKLQALEPIERELGAREAGEAWHGALQDFSELYPFGALPPDARDTLVDLARARFAMLLADPAFSGLAWPNIEKAIDFVLDFERRNRDAIARIWVERRGEIAFPLCDGEPFKLSARADRIDVLRSDRAALIDYKSGRPPGPKEVKVGFAPQLTLEAAILMRGGFEGLGAMRPAEALYLKLGGADGGEERSAAGKHADIAALAKEHLAELKRLLDQFTFEATPYLARPFPKFASRFSDYDHLSRVKEWSATGGEADEAGGDAS